MRKISLYIVSQLLLLFSFAQQSAEMSNHWVFRQAGTPKWYKATVPGTVHTDLWNNRLIPAPFFADNDNRLRWIDTADWEYKKIFTVNKKMQLADEIFLNFMGLDAYADVFLNDKLLLQADNMFRSWRVGIKENVRHGNNELRIYFHSAKNRVDSMAKRNLPIVLPDNPRVYARKAAYQFGWDWGPTFIGAGIWKPVQLILTAPSHSEKASAPQHTKENTVRLIQQKDSIGTSFYFEKDGRPLYVKGANWIPANIFLPSLKKQDYRTLLTMAKDAGMNMLRVWGGGTYEDDAFYELCDSLDIMVWQDFMFAGGMYPGDSGFFTNVKEEVKTQARRLGKYSCIVLWCGNNEIDEAWHHWGWQNQFNLHGDDSLKVWKAYTSLFRDSLKVWVHEFDPQQRPYVSTSPQYGWGNPLSYNNGDSHYWGLWWGLEPWEKFKTHTGRFVSEWGMQAMPDYNTVKKYTAEKDRHLYSPAVVAHQKANEGFKKMNHYIHHYFFDSTKLQKLSLEEYTYLSQCMQFYILKNSIATHMSKQPVNMGTLVWQLNDCWPVTSWSIIDFYKKPKAGYYAVKHAYASMNTVTDKIYPKDLNIHKPTIKMEVTSRNTMSVSSDTEAFYVYLNMGEVNGHLSDNYFSLKAGEVKTLRYNGKESLRLIKKKLRVLTFYDIISK